MEALLTAWIQPFLLAVICGITGFSAWQFKRWMERMEWDHKQFQSRVSELEKFQAAAAIDADRGGKALERIFARLDRCDSRLEAEAGRNAIQDANLQNLDRRVDVLEQRAA